MKEEGRRRGGRRRREERGGHTPSHAGMKGDPSSVATHDFNHHTPVVTRGSGVEAVNGICNDVDGTVKPYRSQWREGEGRRRREKGGRRKKGGMPKFWVTSGNERQNENETLVSVPTVRVHRK
jgi:hypothetical protein